MEHKDCKNCHIRQPVSNFPTCTSKAGNKWYRSICKACKNDHAKTYYKDLSEEEKKIKYNRELARACDVYLRNTTVRAFDEYEWRLNYRWARVLRKKPYFKIHNFDCQEVVADTYLKMVEAGLEYNRSRFYLLMWGYMGKEHYAYIKNNPRLYRNYLQDNRELKKKGVKKISDYYIKHSILRKKYSMYYINNHPELIENMREQITEFRKRKNNMAQYVKEKGVTIETVYNMNWKKKQSPVNLFTK